MLLGDCTTAPPDDFCHGLVAESIIGLFKTEVIRRRGPWRHVEAVEFATFERVVRLLLGQTRCLQMLQASSGQSARIRARGSGPIFGLDG